MPFVMPVSITPDVTINMWNVNAKVGYLGARGGMDVKFVQYLMYADAKPRGKRLARPGVDGKWGPISATCLAGFEKRNGLSPDGCVDPIPPGRVIGSRSHIIYKSIFFQFGYIIVKTGVETVGQLLASGVTPADVEKILMQMPEDNDDMPADLKFALIQARGGSLEF